MNANVVRGALAQWNARPALTEEAFAEFAQPDMVLDELLSILRRAHPTRREAELLLAALAQLARTQTP